MKRKIYKYIVTSSISRYILTKKEKKSFSRIKLDDQYLNKINSKLFNNFFYNEDKINYIINNKNILDEQFPKLKYYIDKIFYDKYFLFGEKIYDFCGVKDIWNFDPVDQYKFKKRYYPPKKLSYTLKLIENEKKKGQYPDILIPFRMSRMNSLAGLGLMYNIENNVKYLHIANKYIINWINNNKYLYSVNWISPMTISLIGMNWIFHIPLIYNKILKKDKKKIIKTLYLFSNYLTKYIENKYDTNNHYIAELVALLCLSILFDFNYSWILNELEKTIVRNTNSDGFDFEGSTAYHRYSTELLLIVFKIARINNIKLSKKFQELLDKRLTVLKEIELSNHSIPIIGDNDLSYIFSMTYPNPPNPTALESIFKSNYKKKYADLNILFYA